MSIFLIFFFAMTTRGLVVNHMRNRRDMDLYLAFVTAFLTLWFVHEAVVG